MATGQLMLLGGIAGIGLSIVIGLIIYASLKKSKNRIKKDLEEKYK